MSKYKHALLTGAGSGLGLGLALRLLKRAVNVSVLDLKLDEAARASLDLAASRHGCRWAYHACDVCDSESLAKCVGDATDRFGSIDLAVNSAGVISNKTFQCLSPAEFRKVIEVNLFGSFNFAKSAIPALTSESRLVFVASMAGLISNYGYSAYGTSKFGVVGLATTLRYEYGHKGIKVVCVCPPEVKTPMVEHERSQGNADPISLALKDFAGSLHLDEACDAILSGIDNASFLVVPGIRSKLTLCLARLSPGAFLTFIDFNVRRLIRRSSSV